VTQENQYNEGFTFENAQEEKKPEPVREANKAKVVQKPIAAAQSE
jgi:hypothetical protein